MPLTIVRNDITEMDVDAVVNPANPALAQGGGVCGAIFHKAGAERMSQACAAIGGCETGQAVITPGFGLKAKHVIHTVSPVWRGGEQGEEALLRSAYKSSLQLALACELESIAFPLISAGVYGYPREDALRVALDEIQSFLLAHDLDVTMVLFDRGSMKLGQALRSDLQSYIDDHYVEAHQYRRTPFEPMNLPMEQPPIIAKGELPRDQSMVFEFPKEETFSEALLSLIDKKGMTDVEAYKNANLDRKLFSKIRSNKFYNPTKRTVLALVIGLKLSMAEAVDLLARAGYAFSPCHKRDLIIMYFIEKQRYNIHEINLELFDFDQELLGA